MMYTELAGGRLVCTNRVDATRDRGRDILTMHCAGLAMVHGERPLTGSVGARHETARPAQGTDSIEPPHLSIALDRMHW